MSDRIRSMLTHKFVLDNGLEIFLPLKLSDADRQHNTEIYGKEYGVSQLAWSDGKGNITVANSDDVWMLDLDTGETYFMPYELRMI